MVETSYSHTKNITKSPTFDIQKYIKTFKMNYKNIYIYTHKRIFRLLIFL